MHIIAPNTPLPGFLIEKKNPLIPNYNEVNFKRTSIVGNKSFIANNNPGIW